MALTLLQIIQRAQAELGLPQASTVIGNTDPTTTQMLALSNRVLDELRRMNRWTAQQFEFDLVVSPPISTTGTIVNGALNVISGIPSTTGIVANYFQVSGPNLLGATRVQSVDSSTQVTMNMEATAASSANDAFQFAQDTYVMPSGFDWFNNATMWDRTNRWQLLGPDSPQQDQYQRSGIVTTGPRRHFRQIGPFADRFRIWPPPFEIVDPLQLVFEYLSIDAVAVHGSLDSFAQYFENDDDQPLLDDQSVVMGVKWMFWEAKGFNFMSMQNRWVDYVDRLIARDGAAQTLSLVRKANPLLLSPAQIPDGFWPGP